ncbi:MAG: hypothetical protein JWN98_2480, partial [Abditibacteriota bacterium]|nr:hypothetical protein [Abditibacteriota bacterium]
EVARPAAGDRSEISWLAARPLEGKTGNINLLFARGRRDVTPGQAFSKRLVGGNWWGGNGELALTEKWKLRGEWMSGKTEDQEDSASAWKLSLDGPVRHPWGEARFSALYRGTDPGWSSYADPRPAVGGEHTEVSVQQDVKIGDISGTTRIGFTGSEIPVAAANVAADAPKTTVDPMRNEMLEGTAQLRWELSPSVTLTTAHAHRATSHEKGGAGEDSATQNMMEHNSSEVGVELKISPTMVVSVGAGQTRVGSDLLKVDADEPIPIFLHDEDRTAIALRRRTRGGAWSLQWNHKTANETVQRSGDRDTSGLQIEAERQLLPWLKVKGGLNFSDDDNFIQRIGNEGARRRIEAELSHGRLGRLGLSYNDWQQHQSSLGAVPLPTQPLALGDSSYSVRYNIGDATGLGLAVEYHRLGRAPEGGPAPQDNWRIGITYR